MRISGVDLSQLTVKIVNIYFARMIVAWNEILRSTFITVNRLEMCVKGFREYNVINGADDVKYHHCDLVKWN